jgi:hypothetical protein
VVQIFVGAVGQNVADFDCFLRHFVGVYAVVGERLWGGVKTSLMVNKSLSL